MQESLIMMLRESLSFLIGYGPDSLMHHFATDRSPLVSAYFPSREIIDSSHSILIDILFQYGILPIGVIGYGLVRSWKNQKEDTQMAILLGLVFLSLNVFVVVHLVLFILLWSNQDLAS
jgi:O-antigen ligase